MLISLRRRLLVAGALLAPVLGVAAATAIRPAEAAGTPSAVTPAVSLPPTVDPVCIDIAHGHPAAASSIQSPAYPAAAAFDEDLHTRWSSRFADRQWLRVDLGAPRGFNAIDLTWEQAYASSYQIQTADDPAGPWTTQYTRSGGVGGHERFTVFATGRYVRLVGLTRATPWGISLWSFVVCGN